MIPTMAPLPWGSHSKGDNQATLPPAWRQVSALVTGSLSTWWRPSSVTGGLEEGMHGFWEKRPVREAGAAVCFAGSQPREAIDDPRAS